MAKIAPLALACLWIACAASVQPIQGPVSGAGYLILGARDSRSPLADLPDTLPELPWTEVPRQAITASDSFMADVPFDLNCVRYVRTPDGVLVIIQGACQYGPSVSFTNDLQPTTMLFIGRSPARVLALPETTLGERWRFEPESRPVSCRQVPDRAGSWGQQFEIHTGAKDVAIVGSPIPAVCGTYSGPAPRIRLDQSFIAGPAFASRSFGIALGDTLRPISMADLPSWADSALTRLSEPGNVRSVSLPIGCIGAFRTATAVIGVRLAGCTTSAISAIGVLAPNPSGTKSMGTFAYYTVAANQLFKLVLVPY